MLSDGAGAFLVEDRPRPGWPVAAYRLDRPPVAGRQHAVCMYAGGDRETTAVSRSEEFAASQWAACRSIFSNPSSRMSACSPFIVEQTFGKSLAVAGARHGLAAEAVDWFPPQYVLRVFPPTRWPTTWRRTALRLARKSGSPTLQTKGQHRFGVDLHHPRRNCSWRPASLSATGTCFHAPESPFRRLADAPDGRRSSDSEVPEGQQHAGRPPAKTIYAQRRRQAHIVSRGWEVEEIVTKQAVDDLCA